MAGSGEGSVDRCGSCGHDLRAGARFCDACGCPVSPASRPTPPPSEYKQVTVLFADVVGSMRLAAAMHPERLQAVMHELFNRGAAVVQRFQGTVEFTGDGLMALFGAPVALEDHALRACIAALEIQSVTQKLSAEVLRADRAELRIRVGLNSGEVVAGEIGSWPGRYTAVGHPVGMAQRMESVAPPDGVLCSESTARLVHNAAELGPLTNVIIKGSAEPVLARQLFSVQSDRMVLGRNEGLLIGRDEELRLLTELFDGDRGGPVGVVGEAGLGKTRLVGQFTEFAAARGARIVVARCEAHTTGVGFRALARLMRAMFGVEGLPRDEARVRAAAQVAGLDIESDDARVLFDAMGLNDGEQPVHDSADGRRRRLVDMMARAVRVHPARTVLVLEDAHWIDGPSDDVIAAFAAALGVTESMFVATYRPEFRGVLYRNSTHTITLRALSPSAAIQVVRQVMGTDPSLSQLNQRIAQAAAGNPFFAEEIVRDLAGRGVIEGSRGAFRLSSDVDRIFVPATVQAVLAARIDRLRPETKSILNAAAVIGSRFDAETLQMVVPQTEPDRLAELVAAELIDQTEFIPVQRFCFHHPLVRTVAYDSQLRATRARTHIALAEAIQRREAFSDEQAAMVAAHLEAAGELDDAYRWHMRAAEWFRPRDLSAARAQWDSARRIADRLPEDAPYVLEMRVAPRALLVSTTLYVRDDLATDETYEELCELSKRTGDEISLAIAMAGRCFSVTVNDSRADEALPMASELREMADRIPCDSETKAILLNSAAFTQFANGEFHSALAVGDEILNLAPTCPEAEIASALSLKGFLQICLGDSQAGRHILREGFELSCSLHPVRCAAVQINAAIVAALGLVDAGTLLEDARAAWMQAESFGDICGILMARWAYGTVLLRTSAYYDEGIAMLRSARAAIDEHQLGVCGLTTVETDLALDSARNGRLDEAIESLRTTFDSALSGFPAFAGFSAEALAQLLIDRGSEDDLAEARHILLRWKGRDFVVPALQLWPLRAQALLARAEGDQEASQDFASRYLRLCEQLNAEGRLDEARRLAAGVSPGAR